jgi:hypothetical protein
VAQPLHFARLEQPSQALRTECGILREPTNFTTVRDLVTCQRCRELLAVTPPGPSQPAGGHAVPGVR